MKKDLLFLTGLSGKNSGDPARLGGEKGTEQRRTTGQRERATNPAKGGAPWRRRKRGRAGAPTSIKWPSAEEGGPGASPGGTTKARSRGQRADETARLRGLFFSYGGIGRRRSP